MTVPLSFVSIVLGLVVSASTRLNAVILGQPVSIPVLGIIAVAVALVALAAVLFLLRLLVCDGLRLRPRMVAA